MNDDTVSITIRIPADVHQWLKEDARRLNGLVRPETVAAIMLISAVDTKRAQQAQAEQLAAEQTTPPGAAGSGFRSGP